MGVPDRPAGKSGGRDRRAVTRRFGLLLLVCLTVLAAAGGCHNEPTGTTIPTIIAISPTPGPTPAATPTTQPTDPAGHQLLPIGDFGNLETGHTLLLPGGQWYDTTDVAVLTQVSDLLVSVDGVGRPTCSRTDETMPLLTLTDCSAVTFRNVRFGYDRASWTEPAEDGKPPLIDLIGCTNIRFEDCEFFGGAGVGIRLDNASGIVLIDCQFYNTAGAPLETGTAWLPSQIDCQNCSFETVDSGLLPLYLRDSRFSQCSWTGRSGYRIPCLGFDPDDAALLDIYLDDESLPASLAGVLAARISFHSDESQAITCTDNLFCSHDVSALYDQLSQDLDDWLPEQAISWALTGQKQEEAAAGSTLDPTLGVALTWRTSVALITPTPTGGGGETTGGGSQTEPSGSQTAETTVGEIVAVYDLNTLLADLQPIKELNDHLDYLITGSVKLQLSDQNQDALLTCSLPVGRLAALLGENTPAGLLAEADILLQNPRLIPAQFYGQPEAGQLTAANLAQIIGDSLHPSAAPLILYLPDDRTCFIEQELLYLGTRLEDGVARHRFRLLIRRSSSDDPTAGSEEITFTLIDIRADNGVKQDLTDGTDPGGACLLATDEQRDIILTALREPLMVAMPEWTADPAQPAEISLQLLGAFSEEGDANTPMLIYEAGSQLIRAKIALYETECRPYLVLVTLELAGDAWQVKSADIVKTP